jgi:hypothetical protein
MDFSSQKTGLKRNTIDKYYTKPEIVIKCIDLIKQKLEISKNDLVIEPSAGNGAFITSIKSLVDNYLFYDLEPENQEIITQDFLNFNLSDCIVKMNINTKKHIIGNPPFGRQSSIAIKFIKKCCSFADSISFILPKSFKKDSMRKHFSNNFHLICEIDLAPNSFLVNSVDMDVPCIFQIWERQSIPRKEIKKLLPIGFTFVDKTMNPDIAFRRVGVNAGTITRSDDIFDKSIQSHYFIKFTYDKQNKKLDEMIDKLKLIKFVENNTVGPKSISKQELILEFNKIMECLILV